MSKGKEIRSSVYARNPRFDYLPESDRYLFAFEKPRYRFNIIGAGMIGQEHIRVTQFEGRATVHGVYDPNPGSIAMTKKNYANLVKDRELVIYDSLTAACNDPDVDGLIICTPNYTHIEVLRQAIKSGKHILLEKPMATRVEDAYEITQLAADYPAVLQIGLQYRYKAQYVEAIHEALERRSLGEIKTISILEHRIPFLDKVKQWNKFSQFSGGTLVEKCCHYFDLMNLFAQSRPVKVFATGSMAVNFLEFEYEGRKSDILDNAFVTVDYENGVRASFNLCMFSPMFYEELILCGDEGRMKVYEEENFLRDGGSHTGFEILRGERHPARIGTPAYATAVQTAGHNGGTYFEHINFVDNIEGKPTNTATVEEGFWSVVVGAAAEESVKTGAPVLIKDLLEAAGVK